MAKTIETILSEACSNGDILTLESLTTKKINLANKSRSKEFNNLFERCLISGLNSKKNSSKVINLVCILAGDNLNKLLHEDLILKIANKYKFFAIDIFINNGWSLGNAINDKNYKTFYDKLFRQSIKYARTDLLIYLIPKFNIDWIYLDKLISLIVNNEDMINVIESRLKNNIEDFSCFYDLLCFHGVTPLDISNILSSNN